MIHSERHHIFKSARGDWRTPRALFQAVNAEFNFDLDVCATKDNALCARFFTPEDDALEQSWAGRCWMNPPYGRDLHEWIAKAAAESSRGATVVALVPARTDTRWFHDHCLGREIRFIKGRLAFDDNVKMRATFPSMLVIFRGKTHD